MAVTFDAVSTRDTSLGSTWAHTVTGANTLLVVDCEGGTSAATFNGVAMTLHQTGSTVNIGVGMKRFRLVAPATGTHNVVLTGAGSRQAIATSFAGVDQTTPLTGGGNGAGNGSFNTSPVTMNVTGTAVTDLVLGAVLGNGTQTWTQGAGETELVDSPQAFSVHQLVTKPGNGGTVALSETPNANANSEQYAHRIQAAAATSSPPRRKLLGVGA